MSPLRYKSRKDSTCHNRSSDYPPSPPPPSPKYSVLLYTLLAIAPSIFSVVYRMYTTFHASSIFRPAASLSYPPSSHSSAEARSTRRYLHYRHAPRVYILPESPGLDILARTSTILPLTPQVRRRVSS